MALRPRASLRTRFVIPRAGRDTRRLLFVACLSALAVTAAGSLLGACGSDAGSAPGVDAGDEPHVPSNVAVGDAGPSGDAGAGSDAAPTSDAGDAGASPLCPTGYWLVADHRACDADASVAPPSVADAAALPGDVVSLAGLDEGNLPCSPVVVCRPPNAATMLFSDDPESPTSDGVLYADTVGIGRVRIYVYHANGGAALRKFTVVVLNQNANDAHVTIKKKGTATPSTDYVGVGKSVAAAWLDSDLSTAVLVPAGTRVLLDADLDGMHATKDQLVHAIFDVEADANVKISVVSVLAATDAVTATAGLPLLPDDAAHDRGTFPGADLALLVSGAPQGARHLRLGANVTEPDLGGTDKTTGKAKTLGGNYGVLYTVSVATKTGFSALLSPRGGEWGGVARVAPMTSAVLMPSAQTSLGATTSAILLGTFGAGTSSFSLVTAGGSNTPLDVVLLGK